MKNAIIQLETLTCPSCLQKIDGALKKLKGIEHESVQVMFNSSKVKFAFNSDEISIKTIENSIENLGYGIIKSSIKD